MLDANPLITLTSSLPSAIGFTLSGTQLQNGGYVLASQQTEGLQDILGVAVLSPTADISEDDCLVAACTISGTNLSCTSGSFSEFLSCFIGEGVLEMGAASYSNWAEQGCDVISSATVVPLCIVA